MVFLCYFVYVDLLVHYSSLKNSLFNFPTELNEELFCSCFISIYYMYIYYAYNDNNDENSIQERIRSSLYIHR